MSSGRFPKPYINDVPAEGNQPGIEHVDFNRMGIGARPSGVPKNPSDGPKGLEHVGKTAGGKS